MDGFYVVDGNGDQLYVWETMLRNLMIEVGHLGNARTVYLSKKEVKRLRKYLKRWLESLEEGE